MNFLTLTPDVQFYCHAVLIMWCLGGSGIATHIYIRWFANSRISSQSMQCIVKGFICITASMLIPIGALFSAPIWLQILSVPIGFIMGRMVVALELFINRYTYRKKSVMFLKKSSVDSFYISHAGPKGKMASLSSNIIQNKSNLKQLHDQGIANESNMRSFSLLAIILIAIFEEIIFRGFLIQYCFSLSKPWVAISMITTVVIFGVSHAGLGVYQMITKTGLGAICLGAVLIFHSVLPAIIIHAVLNWAAYQQIKNRAVVKSVGAHPRVRPV